MTKIAYCGLDLGGTSLKFGLVTANNEIIFHAKKPTGNQKGREEILEIIISSIREVLEKAEKLNYVVSAIGLGTPGSVDVSSGKILGYTPNFKDWGEMELKAILEEKFALPSFIENDANIAAYGEYRCGAGQQFNSIIYLTLGTGIGGGIILNGQMLRGSRYCGGEVGHITIDYNGLICNCGGTGCWEQYASASALVRFYNQRSKHMVKSAFQFFQRVKEKEEIALKVLSDYYVYLGAGLASLINLFDPEAIVIGGGISESEYFSLETVREKTFSRTMFRNDIQFLRAGLGNLTGILGAANFAKDSLHEKKC